MIKRIFSWFIPKQQVPDNFVFHLHYRWTVILLVTLSFTITCRLLVGNSFTCDKSNAPRSQQYLNAICYVDGVYTLPGKLVTNPDAETETLAKEFRRYQPYYSWVNLLLLIHAFNFYLPHLLWKSYESGCVYRLTVGLETLRVKEDDRRVELCYIAKYILATQGKHKLYASVLILCEVLNYAVAVSHTLWLVYFFDVTGVPNVLPLELKTYMDFRQFYFPTIGLCAYDGINLSGYPQSFILKCLLPLNHLFMYIFLFVHAWYILLVVLSAFVLMYRIALLIPSVRVAVTRFHAPFSEKETIKSLCNRLSYSDWLFLGAFRRMMTDIDFAQMLEKIILVPQCSGFENQNCEGNRLSLIDEIQKELDDSTATSPV